MVDLSGLNKQLIIRSMFLMLGFLIIFLILISMNSSASVTTGNTDELTASGQYIGASSSATEVFGISAISDTEATDSLRYINISFSGTGFSTSDIAALTTNSTTSGVGIYNDSGGIDDALDGTDSPITMTSCSWSGTGLNITLNAGVEWVPTSVTGNYHWLIVIRTNASISNNDYINCTINTSEIGFSDYQTQPLFNITTDNITADTQGPTASFTSLNENSGGNYLYYNSGTLYYSDNGATQFTVNIDASDSGSDLDEAVGQNKFTSMASNPSDTSEGSSPNVYELTYTTSTSDTDAGTFTIRVFDNVGNYNDVNFNVEFDNTAPGISYNIPSAGAILSWDYTDPGPYDIDFTRGGSSNAFIDNASYRIDTGGWTNIFTSDQSADYTSDWNVGWGSLLDGVHDVSIGVQDTVGNQITHSFVSSQKGFRLRKDTTVPTITYTYPTAGGNTTWYFSDPGDIIDIDFNWVADSPLDNASYMIEGGSWVDIFSTNQASNYTSEWGITWANLAEGVNNISISVWDVAGNFNTHTFTTTQFGFQFLKDTSLPKITYNYPTRGNDTTWYPSDPGNVIDIDFSKIGTSPLVNASFRIGNGDWENIFNSEQTSFTSNWGITWSNLSEGPNQISIRAFNKAGASITDTFTSALLGFRFMVDTTAPTISYNNPSAGGDTSWYPSSNPGNFVNIDFGWVANAPLTNASYRIGTGNWQAIFGTERFSDFTQNWGLNWGAVPEGTSEISIRVFDKAGNSLVDTYSLGASGFRVRKDITDPGIIYNSPSAGDNTSWYSSDPGVIIDIDFTWIANAPLDNASYRIGAGPWRLIFSTDMTNDYTTDWSLNWHELSNGTNEIHIRAYDKAGNVLLETYLLDTSGFTFKKDMIPPTPVSIELESGDEYTNSTNVTLIISATDALSGIYQMRISNDGVFNDEPWEGYTTSKVWTLSNGDGNKTVYIMFRDNALVQSAVISDYILLDTTPPNFGNWSMTPGDVTEDTTGEINITVEINDLLGSGVFKVTINYSINGESSGGFIAMEKINNTLWRLLIDPAGLGTGYTWDDLQGDTISYTVRVSDHAGNVGLSSTRTELIDSVNDAPKITNDDKTTGKEEVSYSITYTATDIDLPADTLTWSLDTNASWLAINTSTGVVSGTPAKGDAGTYYVNVTVSDGRGGIDWQRFTLVVDPIINKDPKITGKDLLTIEAGTTYFTDYEATDDRTAVKNLTWSLDTNASWLSIDTSNGELSGTPQLSDVGSYSVTVSVSDDEGGITSRSFTVTVTRPANSRPKLENGKMEPSSGNTDTTFIFSVEYSDADNDEGEVLVWIDGEKNEMVPDDSDSDFTDGVLYTFESKLDEGNHSFYFTASDGIAAATADDSTPITEATAAKVPDIEKAEPSETEDQTMMFVGIAIVIIVIILLVMFMFMRGRGTGVGVEDDMTEPESGKPKIVGAVEGDEDIDELEEGELEDEMLETEDEEYPYDDVSTPGGYDDYESGELADEVADEMDMDMDLEAETQVSAPLKPAVTQLELEDQMELMELGLVMPCSVCQGIMPVGEKVFQCTCGLVSHKDCVTGLEVCPQCGKEITIPELKKPEAKKKLPMIKKEVKREIEEQTPPSKAYFTFIPGKSTDKELAKYLSGYFKSKEFGTADKDDELRFVRLFITPDSAKIMLDHCYEHGRKKEVMGLMIGQTFHYKNDVFSVVKNVVTSELDATEVNVKFDSFEKLFDQLDDLDYDYQIIGWYHSHPSYTSFMSPTDVDTQRRMFKHPYQYAVVIDPIKFDMNAFTLDQVNQTKVKEKPFAIFEPET